MGLMELQGKKNLVDQCKPASLYVVLQKYAHKGM